MFKKDLILGSTGKFLKHLVSLEEELFFKMTDNYVELIRGTFGHWELQARFEGYLQQSHHMSVWTTLCKPLIPHLTFLSFSPLLPLTILCMYTYNWFVHSYTHTYYIFFLAFLQSFPCFGTGKLRKSTLRGWGDTSVVTNTLCSVMKSWIWMPSTR